MNLHIESTKAVLVTGASSVGAMVGTGLVLDLGLPLPELIAAFAGAGLILSFLPAQRDEAGELLGVKQKLGTILFCTLAATWGWPWLAQLADVKPGGWFAAFAVGAGLQVALPMAISKRAQIAAWALSFIPKRGG